MKQKTKLIQVVTIGLLTTIVVPMGLAQTHRYSVDYTVGAPEPGSDRARLVGKIKSMPNYIPPGTPPTGGGISVATGPIHVQGTVEVSTSPDGSYGLYSVIHNSGLGRTMVIRTWVSPEFSLQMREHGPYVLTSQEARSGRYMLPSDQHLLTGVIDSFVTVDTSGEFHNVYQRPVLSEESTSGVPQFMRWTLNYSDSSKSRIVSGRVESIIGGNSTLLREYEVEGEFGQDGYRVRMITFAFGGVISDHWLEYTSSTEEVWHPGTDLEIGTEVLDTRSGGNAVRLAWNGAPAPEADANGGLPTPILYVAASLLCLAAGVFFWRRR